MQVHVAASLIGVHEKQMEANGQCSRYAYVVLNG